MGCTLTTAEFFRRINPEGGSPTKKEAALTQRIQAQTSKEQRAIRKYFSKFLTIKACEIKRVRGLPFGDERRSGVRALYRLFAARMNLTLYPNIAGLSAKHFGHIINGMGEQNVMFQEQLTKIEASLADTRQTLNAVAGCVG